MDRSKMAIKPPSQMCFVICVATNVLLLTVFVFRAYVGTRHYAFSFRDSIPKIAVPSNTNCSSLFEGDVMETKRIPRRWKGEVFIPDDKEQSNRLVKETARCDLFRKNRKYIGTSLSEEEDNFPIAYSLLVFKNPSQVEDLLRAIYRSQNLYCIHIDSKAPQHFKKAIQGLARCFTNVFVPSNCTDVQWGLWGVLEAETICMRELSKSNKRWKYFINLTGQEFPLRTNLEIVRILTTLNGSNDVEFQDHPINTERWTYSYKGHDRVGQKDPPPHGIKIYKGSTHVVLSRKFVDFLLSDLKIQDFYTWLMDTVFPEETFIPTIQGNPHLNAPGTFTEMAAKSSNKATVARNKLWTFEPEMEALCHGRIASAICIPSTKDLPRLGTAHELFVNKLHADYEPIVRYCLEERLFQRTQEDALNGGTTRLNMTLYENLPIVHNHQ